MSGHGACASRYHSARQGTYRPSPARSYRLAARQIRRGSAKRPRQSGNPALLPKMHGWTPGRRRRRLGTSGRRRSSLGHPHHPGGASAMNDSVTMHTGPLGSTIHVLRADAGTIAELAAIDWNRHFPRVCLDPVRGVITLMAPSRLHEDLSDILGDIVKDAGSTIAGAVKRHPQHPASGTGRAARHGDGARLRVLRRRARQRLSRGPCRRGRGGRRLRRACRAGPGGGGRDHATPTRARSSATGSWGAGAVAAARAQGHEGAARGAPRPAARQRAASSDASVVLEGSRPRTSARRWKGCASA